MTIPHHENLIPESITGRTELSRFAKLSPAKLIECGRPHFRSEKGDPIQYPDNGTDRWNKKKDMTGLGRTYWLFDIGTACLVRRVSFCFIIPVTSPNPRVIC